MRNLCRSVLAPLMLLALCAPSFGADSERDRKARAALALAGSKGVAVATAPAPRAVVTRDYATAAKAATDQNKPLVVFVGCKAEHLAPGAITARADTLRGETGPAAVVLYPVRGELYQHRVLKCPVDDADLRTAVRGAAQKVDEPPLKGDKAAPKPLNWDVRAEPTESDLKETIRQLESRLTDAEMRLYEQLAKKGCDCTGDCCKNAPVISAVPPARAVADPIGACVRVSWDRFSASGVCVAYENGKSLVVSNNHVFTEKRTPFGEFARADYPLECSVRTLDGKRTLRAIAVDGDKDADLAFLIVDGELPVAEMATADAPIGTKVWHRGIGSGGGQGKVLPVQQHPQAKQMFASDCSSESGDSGAGVFDQDGRLVAVNCGRHSIEVGAAQRGTPITPIRNLARGVARTAFPKMAAKLSGNAAPAGAPPVVKVAGAKVLKWQGVLLADQSPTGYFAEIKKAWPNGATVETVDAIDYYPNPAAWEAELARTRPTGPTTIITPGGGSQTVVVEGPGGVGGPRGAPSACPGGVCPTAPRYSFPVQPNSCPSGRCPLQR